MIEHRETEEQRVEKRIESLRVSVPLCSFFSVSRLRLYRCVEPRVEKCQGGTFSPITTNLKNMNVKSITQILTSTLVLLALVMFQACKPEEIKDDPKDDNPNNIKVEAVPAFAAGESATRTGNLSSGIQIDLDWADQSNVACFPGTRFTEFMGNQVFYSVQIPQGAELIVTVTPTDDSKRINLYGYIDFKGSNLPPISSCLSCEAGYELYAGTPDLTKPNQPQDISFAQAVNDPFTALIVVSGAQNVLEGEYTLLFELKPM